MRKYGNAFPRSSAWGGNGTAGENVINNNRGDAETRRNGPLRLRVSAVKKIKVLSRK